MPGAGGSPVKLEVGRRLAVLWDGDDCYYPAQVIKHDRRTGNFTILYSDGDTEVLQPFSIQALSLIALPPDVNAPCGGDSADDSDSLVCGEEIDLSARLVLSSKHVVCTACSTAYHFSCAENLMRSFMADKNGRPPRLTGWTTGDATWLAKWRCPRCEMKAPVKEEPRPSAKKSKAMEPSRGGVKASKSNAQRNSAGTLPDRNALRNAPKNEFRSMLFRMPRRRGEPSGSGVGRQLDPSSGSKHPSADRNDGCLGGVRENTSGEGDKVDVKEDLGQELPALKALASKPGDVSRIRCRGQLARLIAAGMITFDELFAAKLPILQSCVERVLIEQELVGRDIVHHLSMDEAMAVIFPRLQQDDKYLSATEGRKV